MEKHLETNYYNSRPTIDLMDREFDSDDWYGRDDVVIGASTWLDHEAYVHVCVGIISERSRDCRPYSRDEFIELVEEHSRLKEEV